MNKNTERKKALPRFAFPWKVWGIFVALIALICGIVFIVGYELAYNKDGTGWLPPSLTVVFHYLIVMILCVIAAITLKLVWKKRVSLAVLLLTAVLLPVFCYHFNYHTLKKDGLLFPLVDQGGILHFLAIGDYNFDGMNDRQHHLLYDEREVSSGYGGHFEDSVVHYITTKAVGVGIGMDAYCSYDWESQTLQLHINRDHAEYKEIEIRVVFQEESYAQKVSFSLTEPQEKKIEHRIVSKKTAVLTLDADTVKALQENSESEFPGIPIKYMISSL